MIKKNRNYSHHLMVAMALLCSLFLIIASTPDTLRADDDAPGHEYTASEITAFYEKIIPNPISVDANPFRDYATSSWYEYPEEAVCAVKYADDRIQYVIATFDSEDAAEESGFIVTQKGHCGACSTLQDLATFSITGPAYTCQEVFCTSLVQAMERPLPGEAGIYV